MWCSGPVAHRIIFYHLKKDPIIIDVTPYRCNTASLHCSMGWLWLNLFLLALKFAWELYSVEFPVECLWFQMLVVECATVYMNVLLLLFETLWTV